MSEPFILIGIGFLLAISLMLCAKPLAQSRVGRSAMRRLESAAPSLMADIEADMDELHSQIAVATRRLEMSVEQMKLKTTGQLSEIGKTSATIGRLKLELAERAAALASLQEKENVVAAQLRTTEAELAVKSQSLDETEHTLAERKEELIEVMAQLRVNPELAKLESRHRAEMESLTIEKSLVEQQLASAQDECTRLQVELEAVRKQVASTWATERMANAVLRERINDVASEVVRVAVALEGLTSPMDALAAGAVETRAPQQLIVNGTVGQDSLNGNGQDVVNGGNGQDHGLSLGGEDGSKAALVHRIRALRRRAAREPGA
jgi:chromosome segregation ATPase